MDIKHGEHKFYIGEDEANPRAEITYVEAGENKIIIDHTYVSDELRGQKVGNQLLETVVTFARNKDKKVIPLCPFAKAQFDRNPAYEDVLDK